MGSRSIAWLEMQTPVDREFAYYEELYSGFAQQHFAKPAVVAFRQSLVTHLRRVLCLGCASTVLSLGCGIGDTELLLAPYVDEIVGVDLSPSAIDHANEEARRLQVANARFLEGEWQTAALRNRRFDAVIGVYFLHHLSDTDLEQLPHQLLRVLKPGGRVYALDPSDLRLSEMVGKLLVPDQLAKYQTEDERPLNARKTAELFRNAGFDARSHWYDFVSTPLAGLKPDWATAYRITRQLDHALVRVPLLNRLSNAFELIAAAPR